MLCSYSNKTLAHNSIYSIHSSYYSFVISLYLELAVSTIYLIINAYSSFSYFDYCSLLTFHFSSFSSWSLKTGCILSAIIIAMSLIVGNVRKDYSIINFWRTNIYDDYV